MRLCLNLCTSDELIINSGGDPLKSFFNPDLCDDKITTNLFSVVVFFCEFSEVNFGRDNTIQRFSCQTSVVFSLREGGCSILKLEEQKFNTQVVVSWRCLMLFILIINQFDGKHKG